MRWLVVVALTCTACAGPPPAPAPPDPVEQCTAQLVYWAGEDLRGAPDLGYDYQHRALSTDQNDALRAAVAQGRARGATTVDAAVEAELRAACAVIVG